MRISDWSSDVCSSDLAVAGAMGIIDPVGPQILPRQNVELAAACAGGKARGGQRDMAFQHLGEATAHFRRRGADRDRAGDVGRAVGILAARIDQIQRSEEHTSELQSLMRISYAVFCLKKKTK